MAFGNVHAVLKVMVLGSALLGISACGVFGGGEDRKVNEFGVPGSDLGRLGVNGYLWRASLETIAFMPLAATDSTGGTIMTDWYAPPDVADERLKVTVYILDRRLRADALRVVVFRQELGEDGSWNDSAVQAGTAKRLEDAILTKARQIRIRSIGEG